MVGKEQQAESRER